MNQSVREQKSSRESRIAIISTVKTPLGFFTLIVLIVEVIFSLLASYSIGADKTYLIIGMMSLIFLLVLIVAGMAIFRPMSLYGKENIIRTATHHDLPKDIALSIETVNKPRFLVACSLSDPLGSFDKEMNHDTELIRNYFPNSSVTTQKEITACKFREMFTRNKFDIVHLTVNVGHDGSIIFSENDIIPSRGVVELIEVSKTKLLILACCNSVPLAAELAAKTNMIAATSTLMANGFAEWQPVFYQLLSDGISLSRAYSIASSAVQLPIAILMKQDVVFNK